MLSVVIPVYNTEKYLRACLDSLLKQTYQDFEVILVNDGSADDSGKICDEYAERYPNFHVFHQENQGVVAARNKGLEYAKGKFISYIDSDDWLDSNYYETLMPYAEKNDADMVTSGMMYEWSYKREEVIDSVEEGAYDKAAIKECVWDKMIYDFEKNKQGISASLSNKIIKRDYLERVTKRIDTNIKYCEDGAIIYALLTKINKLVVTHYCGYHYIQHEDSSIHTYTTKAFDSICALQKCMEREMLAEQENVVLKQQIKMYVTSILRTAISSIYGILINMPIYVFPYHCVPQGSRIILYGAGGVGKWYYKCLKEEKYVTLSAWVDKKYQEYQGIFPVEPPEVIIEKQFDYVVVAIEKENIAKEIISELVQAGIDVNIIVWEQPQRIMQI